MGLPTRCSNCDAPLMIGNNHHCLCLKCLDLAKQGNFVTVIANEHGSKRLPPGVTQEQYGEDLRDLLALKEAAKIVRGEHPDHKPS